MEAEILRLIEEDVAPHGGAWIEISYTFAVTHGTGGSPLTEGRGLKSGG